MKRLIQLVVILGLVAGTTSCSILSKTKKMKEEKVKIESLQRLYDLEDKFIKIVEKFIEN